ncbi:MAG: 4Fe-4S dicluster domain-containing protein [Firmicutes bacterium]|nr:4Fe-4S dicluster domain-containing protein [Bacillota bacterium]
MTVHIDGNICKGCGLCLHFCSQGVFVMSEEINKKGFAIAAAVKQENCTKCKLCELNCPDLAVWVE